MKLPSISFTTAAATAAYVGFQVASQAVPGAKIAVAVALTALTSYGAQRLLDKSNSKQSKYQSLLVGAMVPAPVLKLAKTVAPYFGLTVSAPLPMLTGVAVAALITAVILRQKAANAKKQGNMPETPPKPYQAPTLNTTPAPSVRQEDGTLDVW
jgi:hypothetical protein